MKRTLEYVGSMENPVSQDNREILAHGTEDFPMSVHMTRVLTGIEIALYYHWHDELEILYMASGKMRICIGHKEYILNSGDMAVISPGVPHMAYREDSGEITYYAVLVHMNFLSSRYNDLIQNHYILPVFMGWRKIPEKISQDMNCYSEIRRSIEYILEFYRVELPGYELMIKSCLFSLLYHITAASEDGQDNENFNSRWVRAVLYFIKNNYNQKITLKDMANYVNMSDGYFCRSMEKVFKTSPMEFLNRYRISQAVRMIESSNKKLGDIAFETGFCNVNRFTNSFKKIMSCTPLQYRQKLTKNLKTDYKSITNKKKKEKHNDQTGYK